MRRSVLVLGLWLAACGSSDETGLVGQGSVSQEDAGEEAAGGRRTRPTEDAEPPEPAHEFSIEFDYRFDTVGWFDAAERRDALRAAARLWQDRIADDFLEIPAGTEIRIRNLEQVDDTFMTFAIDEPIDDLLVFVACSEVLDDLAVSGRTRRSAYFPANMGAGFQQSLQTRWAGSDQEPWAVGIAFACNAPFFFDATPDTDDDVPAGAVDFVTVASHELGHALGIGSSETYLALQSDDGSEFLGKEAMHVTAGPVPLDADGNHLSSSLRIDGAPVLMDVSTTVGRRTWPTRLEYAILEDIGYEILPP